MSEDDDSAAAPARLLLAMVRELHLRGYQRLRIAPGFAPSGLYWRCTLAPASDISLVHGAMLSAGSSAAVYSTGDGYAFFGWNDAAGSNAAQLAEMFLSRFPDLCERSRGLDAAYLSWYLEMLARTAPDALPYAYADWDLPTDFLPTTSKAGLRIALPPPGEARR